ncbi:MAG: leucyl aminopeptidase [Actinobacteria bacterium]|nr:leucyl aminopeptidase [Actinomycetota bacterium]
MTSIRATDASIAKEILVVGLARGSDKKLRIESGALKVSEKQLLDALEDMGATGKPDEVIKLPGTTSSLLVLTGLGQAQNGSRYPHETLRRAAGAAARSLMGKKSATFSLPHHDESGFAAIAEGSLLGAYSFNEFKGSASRKESPVAISEIVVHSKQVKSARAKEILGRAQIISRYTSLVRDLINTPPSHLTPESFCQRFKKVASGTGVKVEILNDLQLRRLGYGGTLAVGQGSASKPRLLHISYTPKQSSKRSKKSKRLAFVGKGITFDTGGLALKPAQGMEAMKSDMSGAAAVCAALLAIAELKLPVAVDAWAPLAENMVSDTATRPSDIITIYGGKTVEVLNPDAEGRLVLADGLVRATEVAKKAGGLDLIIDVATLTGAQVVALGTRTSAVMTNNDQYCDRFLEICQKTGEQFWPMPLPEELRASLDSPVADIANIGDRMGGMLVAGLFLKEFVLPEIPWLHLDIAGPAFNTGSAHGYTPVGGTGVALRTLVALAEDAARS